MRLISQDGFYDVPYENTPIGIADDNSVFAYSQIHMFVLGNYSSEEKALKVMSMLQQAYIGRNETAILRMPDATEEEKDLLERTQKQLRDLVVVDRKSIPTMEFVSPSDYFKFPADEEVEV